MSTAATILRWLPRELLDSPVSDFHLAQIARDLKNWEEVAPILELPEAQEEEVRRTFVSYGDQKREALRAWKREKGQDATYRRLITALCCVQNVKLAEQIRDLLKPPELEDAVPSTNVWDRFREYLIDCCKAARHPSHEQWPLLGISTYVELTLREVPTEDDTNVKEVRLSKIFVSSHKASRKFVLIEGPPGSGKTTLTWHALQEWAEGKLFQQFSLLIPISLSNADPTVLNATCLADIIPHESKDMREKVAKAIAEKSGKGVCFFIDSWDEAPMSFFQQRSYLHHLIMGGTGKKSLPHCSIVVTSRPVASGDILRFANSHLMINGFNWLNIEEFIYSTLRSDTDREKFVYMLQAKQELFALCHSPLLLSIAMHIFTTSSHDLPSTQTELFTALVLSKLVRHKSLRVPGGNDLEEVGDIVDLPENMLIKFRALCKLAYIGLRECRSSFSIKEIKEYGVVSPSKFMADTLSLMKVHKQIMSSGIRSSYSFLHFTIQEYLAAYHINSLDPKEQVKMVEQLVNILPLAMTISFYAGLSKLENRGVLDVLLKVSEKRLNISSVLKQLNEIDNPGSDPRRLFLTLVNSIYESRNHNLYRCFQPPPEHLTSPSFFESSGNGLDISMYSFYLTPSYCLSLGHFLKYASLKGWVYLDVTTCSITDVGLPLIVKEVCSMGGTADQSCGIGLSITTNPITHRALECMRYGLGCITEFNFGTPLLPGFNVFLALKYLAEGISRSSHFILLSMYYIITIKHMYHLLLLMISSKSLRRLFLANNDLRGAIPILSVGLKYNKNIESLSLYNCSLKDKDLHELGNALYHCNTTLKILIIDRNNFTSEAFTAFLKAIRDSKSDLRTLHYDGELNMAQQEVVDEIQLWRKANRMPRLKMGPLAATFFKEMLKVRECVDIAQNLPPSLLTGIDK